MLAAPLGVFESVNGGVLAGWARWVLDVQRTLLPIISTFLTLVIIIPPWKSGRFPPVCTLPAHCYGVLPSHRVLTLAFAFAFAFAFVVRCVFC